MIEYMDAYLALGEKQGWRCYICGKALTTSNGQLAHRIPQRKSLLKEYGRAIIHSMSNLRLVCGLDCNSRAQASAWEWDKIAAMAAKEG